MIITMKAGGVQCMMQNARYSLRTSFCNEKGQALIEHSLIIGSITSSFALIRDHPYFIIGIAIAALIILLLWRPKFFAALVFIIVLSVILFFVYRWVEYGHI